MTTASRSLATALSKARFASGLLPNCYTTTRDTTAQRRKSPQRGTSVVKDATVPARPPVISFAR